MVHDKHFLRYTSTIDTPELIRNRVSQLSESRGFDKEVHVSAARDERGDYQGFGHLFVRDPEFHSFLLARSSSGDISDQDLKITACASEVPGLSAGTPDELVIVHIGIQDAQPDPVPPLHSPNVITTVVPPGVRLEWVRRKIEMLCALPEGETTGYPVITSRKSISGEILRCTFDPTRNHGKYIMLMIRRLWYPLVNGREVLIQFFYEKVDRRSYSSSRERSFRESRSFLGSPEKRALPRRTKRDSF